MALLRALAAMGSIGSRGDQRKHTALAAAVQLPLVDGHGQALPQVCGCGCSKLPHHICACCAEAAGALNLGMQLISKLAQLGSMLQKPRFFMTPCA